MSHFAEGHPTKIRFFLSSSSEQLPIAKALEANITEEGFEPTIWSRGVHSPSQYNLEALLKVASFSDFAIFIFAPDDEATMRGEKFSVVRDNVLFELGLFIGILGRDHCFIVQSSEPSMRWPSDLHGITAVKYQPRSDGNLSRAVGPVLTTIVNYVLETTRIKVSKFTNNDLKLLQSCKYPSMPSNQAAKAFGSTPDASVDKLCMRFVHLLEHGLIKSAGATEIEATLKGNMVSTEARSRL